MTYRFHAAAPPGEWINDPNALFFAAGRYHLYVQHAVDGPAFKQVGWGHLSSLDLMNWRWEGRVLEPDERGYAYSGSLLQDPPELFFTRHDPARPQQTQHRAKLSPDFANAAEARGAFGPAGRNVRDPFVWRCANGWRMLIARPCDWTAWRDDRLSRLELWGSRDRADWTWLAKIGPWSPAGVIWEVPTLIDFGDVQALFISLIDRRADTADCQVRYWLGRLTDKGFTCAVDFPSGGLPVDYGPDFYAAIPNAPVGWPSSHWIIVGWASSWATARVINWPDQRGGGPVSTPRRVILENNRLRFTPALPIPADEVGELHPRSSFVVHLGGATLSLHTEVDRTHILRSSPTLPSFERQCAPITGPVSVYRDGSTIEIFCDGKVVTAAMC